MTCFAVCKRQNFHFPPFYVENGWAGMLTFAELYALSCKMGVRKGVKKGVKKGPEIRDNFLYIRRGSKSSDFYSFFDDFWSIKWNNFLDDFFDYWPSIKSMATLFYNFYHNFGSYNFIRRSWRINFWWLKKLLIIFC